MPEAVEVDDFFAHYGIKGMRWGVRKRRSAGGGSSKSKPSKSAPAKPQNHTETPVHKQAASQTPGKTSGGVHTPSNRLPPHEVKKLTDKELKDRIARIELEQKYAKLTAPQLSPGRKMINEILQNTARNSAQSILSTVSTHYIDQLMKSAGLKPAKDASGSQQAKDFVSKVGKSKPPYPGQLAITR